MAQTIDLLKNSSFESKLDSLIEAILQGENFDYTRLENKPTLNGYTIEGDKTNAQLGIPTNTSEIINNSGYVSDTDYVHTDNNFTAELKTKLDSVVSNAQADWNITDSADASYIKNKPAIPTKMSELTNDSGFVTDTSYIHTDNNYTDKEKASVATIANKVDVVDGKTLTTNDLTNVLKENYDSAAEKAHSHINKAILDATTASFTAELNTKLSSIEANAQVNTVTGVKGSEENTYRVGNISITKENVGLGSVANERQWSDSNHPTTIVDYGIKDAASSSDLSSVITRVASTETSISSLNTNVSDIKSDVSTIQTSVSSHTTEIANLDKNTVKNTITINNYPLTDNISLTYSDVGAISASLKGVANGVAELDANGLIPTSALPSFVDDVLEGTMNTSHTEFTITGETEPVTPENGKIYIDVTTNMQYRWSGTLYVSIGSSLALGETSSTAYFGDKGKLAYDHSQVTSGNPHNVTASDVGLGNVSNVVTNDLSPTFTQASARENVSSGNTLSILFGKIAKWFSDLKAVAFSGSYNDLLDTPTNATTSSGGLMSASDKNKLNNIEASANNYSLPKASASVLGGVKVGVNLSVDDNGVLNATNTEYSTVTTTTNGLMSSTDKAKLNGIETNANNYTLPIATATELGGVKVGKNLSISDGVLSAKNTEYSIATSDSNGLMSTDDYSYLHGIEEGAQVNDITGIKGDAETVYRTGKVNITAANIGLENVDNTADKNKSVLYAVTSGNANTVNNHTLAVDVPVGALFTDTNTWIAFVGATESSAGTAGYVPAPTAGSQEMFFRGDGVWATPVDTDTHYKTRLKVGASATATTNAVAANGSVYMNVMDNTMIRDTHKIVGTGCVQVSSDANGNITIYGEPGEGGIETVFVESEPTSKSANMIWIYDTTE